MDARNFLIVFFILIFISVGCFVFGYEVGSDAAEKPVFHTTYNEDAGYEYGYDDGFIEGYDCGYYDALSEAPEYIENRVEDAFFDLMFYVEDLNGMSPDKAINILTNYADVREEATDEEVEAAIWAISNFYNGVYDIRRGISEYDLY